ncbi:MAG TPA: hypothetical protein VGF29_01875 [Hyphomicrobiaceae bacterium]|jgi:hypothetical protein
MTENTQDTTWNHRGPLPPWPAEVDIVGWLHMSSEERAEHFRQRNEKEKRVFGEDCPDYLLADVRRMTAFWDHLAALLEMDSRERAEQIRRDMEQAWAGFGDEIERQTERWTRHWDQVAEAAKQRRAAAGADAR